MLAANTIKDRFGVQTGDEVSLRTNEGFQNFEVEGIVVDFTGGWRDIYWQYKRQ